MIRKFSQKYLLLLTLGLAPVLVLGNSEQEFSEIVNSLNEEAVDVPRSRPVSYYFTFSGESFRNNVLQTKGTRYIPEVGLSSLGQFRFFGRYPLLSGTVEGQAVQEFANFGFGFDYNLLTLSKQDQVDFWLDLDTSFRGRKSERTLATQMDVYRLGGILLGQAKFVQIQLGGGYSVRKNETDPLRDAGDMLDASVELSALLFAGVRLGGYGVWKQVSPLKLDGEELTPLVTWIMVGPKLSVPLATGLRIQSLLLFPVQKSDPSETIELALSDSQSVDLDGGTLSIGIEAGF